MSGLGIIDISIVAIYLAAMISIGFWTKRLAARGVDSYFLGERRIPWVPASFCPTFCAGTGGG